jgi:hypothetical protein
MNCSFWLYCEQLHEHYTCAPCKPKVTNIPVSKSVISHTPSGEHPKNKRGWWNINHVQG